MPCEICCWNSAERTVPGTIVQACFKLTYILYMLAVPIFLIWMIVATKPVDQEVFGPVQDMALLKGNISLFTEGVQVVPSIADVHPDKLNSDCGAPGFANWNISVITTKPLEGAKLPVILASDAMTDGKLLPPDSPQLKWHAIAQPYDFGGQSLNGPQYETPWLRDVGCRSQSKAAKLSGQDKLLVCVSSKGGGAAAVDDCDLIKATCTGGMGGWLTHSCSDGLMLQSWNNDLVAKTCKDKALKPTGICKDPENATDCNDCKKWGCKTPDGTGCKVHYTQDDCEKSNPPSAHAGSFPEFKITIHDGEGRFRKDPLQLVGKSIQLFLADGEDGWSHFYSSSEDEPFAQVETSEGMAATAVPKWCFGPRSQSFYMVACLTASSGVNAQKWWAHEPPKVDGPPFNDRCAALVGLCGSMSTAAEHSGLPRDYCTEQGTIPVERLVKLVSGRRNGGSFWFYGFIFFMILAHMSTLVTYFGGLFRTDYINDSDALTERTMHRCTGWEELKNHKYSMRQVGAIVLWGASKSEERLFILRNWIGRVACVPHWEGQVFGRVCRCVDVFMDEGHRVGARELWLAFIAFLDTRPPRSFLEEWSKRLCEFNFDDARTTSRGQSGDPFKGLNWLLDLQQQATAPKAPMGDRGTSFGAVPCSSLKPVGEDAGGETAEPSSAFHSLAPESMELASERAQPLVLSVAQEVDEKNFGHELGDVNSPCVQALCRLMEAFRDARFLENLEPKEQGSTAQEKTRDIVLHHHVGLSEDCTVDFLYVARAREKEVPLAAYRVLALQHVACLNLPLARAVEEDAVEIDRQELADLVKSIAGMLWIAERHFVITDTAGRQREVHLVNLWRQLVRVKDVAISEDPNAQVNLEWFERVNNQWLVRKGCVAKSCLEIGHGFKPMVPGIEELSPWEVGRLCSGKIVQLDSESVTLDGLSLLMEYLIYDDDFRRLACAGNPGERTRMLRLRRAFATPFCGSRGKGGAQNFALQLLRNRGLLRPPDGVQGLSGVQAPLSLAQRGRARPLTSVQPAGGGESGLLDGQSGRVLFAIFDARHQPTPDYFKEVLPVFFRRNEENEYQLDKRVAFAQVPQTFSRLEVVDDSLDTNNGMMFNMLNLVRNNCGAVTSCGTNSTWQVESSDALPDEVFDARTKIEDTATSHKVFLEGRRSVYVNSPCVIGIAKRNARYLGAVARWSEGAVQLFWVTLLGDRNASMVFLVGYKLAYVCLIIGLLLVFSLRSRDSYLFCQSPSTGICGQISERMGDPSGSSIHAIEGALVWAAVVLINILLFDFMRCSFAAAPIVRRIVMLDNLTYFWSTGAAFFWVLLNFYMIISGTIPFSYDIRTWMCWLLFIKVLQYTLTYIMKSKGECQEASIWRSQQMFFLTAPLHQMSILLGTASAFSIFWRGIDKSFWDTDNSNQVLCLVKAWTTFIVGSAAAAIVAVLLALLVNSWNVTSSIISATIIYFFMAVCVFDAFMDVWEITAKMQRASNPGWAEQGGRWVQLRRCWSAFCRLCWNMRYWTWIVRWIMDFGMPIAVLVLIQRGSFGIAAAFSFLLRV